MSGTKKIEGLLESVSGSLGELDELERAYNESRGALIKELASHLNQLAALSDGQATRARLVREMYWNLKIPAELIGKAFGLFMHRMKKMAGSLVLTLTCPAECGNSVKREFGSRSELKDYQYEVREGTRHSYTSCLACDECKRKAEAEREAEAARTKRRDAELRAMPWEWYVETEEWVEIRNKQMGYANYKCERCHADGIGLYVYLAEGTPQCHPNFVRAASGYYVLCPGCVPMCAELINPEKGEYVKSEFIPIIAGWSQGHGYEGLRS